jgi:hypothetical protein
VYLYLGSSSGTYQRVDIAAPDGVLGQFGNSVASAGDVNGDGYADFLVGAVGASSNAGTVHLFLGEATPTATDWNGTSPPKRIDINSPDGANGEFGYSVSSVGDFNGDGYADFVIGATVVSSSAGAAHLYFGEPAPTGADWNGSPAAQRVDIAGPDGSNAYFGNSVASAGDVNGDGFADFLVGAPGAASNAGAVHLYLGGGSTVSQHVDLVSPDGASSYFGNSVASAGDVNGDGYADFLIAAYMTSSSTGVAHLYLGEATPTANDWNPPSPTKRIDLADPDGANALFGISVARAGDVNGDGYTDFLVGASGFAHLYLGESSPAASDWNGASAAKRIDLTNPDGTGSAFGSSVAAAGDINGDGYPDFSVAAVGASSRTGAAHLYFGESTLALTDWNGTTPPKRTDFAGPDGANAAFACSIE